jgi:hypothetical protein
MLIFQLIMGRANPVGKNIAHGHELDVGASDRQSLVSRTGSATTTSDETDSKFLGGSLGINYGWKSQGTHTGSGASYELTT